jgi:hypothetical protein
MNESSEIKKAYVNLISLKKNIPQYQIKEKYVDMYHTEIDRLIKLGLQDLEEFKIPENEITPRVTSSNMMTNEKTYSSERYVEREIFLIKLDAILSYFEVAQSQTEIGFKGE